MRDEDNKVGKITLQSVHNTQSLLWLRDAPPSPESQTKKSLMHERQGCAHAHAAAQLHQNIKYIVGSHGEAAGLATQPRTVGGSGGSALAVLEA